MQEFRLCYYFHWENIEVGIVELAWSWIFGGGGGKEADVDIDLHYIISIINTNNKAIDFLK